MTLSEDIAEATRASDARTAARQTLAFLILGYFSFVVAFIIGIFSFAGIPSKADEPWLFLLRQSVVYSGFSLTVVPQVWYLYRRVQRRRGSEGPDASVGVVAPILVGYVILVLGPFFGFYPSIIPDESLFFLLYLVAIPLLLLIGLAYISSFYLFVVRKKDSKLPEDKKAQTPQVEDGSVTEEAPSDDNTVTAFKLLVLGYCLLLAGPLIGYFFQGGLPGTLPVSHGFYLGASVMVLSQVWYLLVGGNQKSSERRESKNTLLIYVVAPALVGYAVFFVVPVLGFMPFAEAYRYAFAVFRNLLVPVLFFVGAIYAALFYVYRIA